MQTCAKRSYCLSAVFACDANVRPARVCQGIPLFNLQESFIQTISETGQIVRDMAQKSKEMK